MKKKRIVMHSPTDIEHSLIRTEFEALVTFLRRYYHELVVLSASTLFFLLYKYYPIGTAASVSLYTPLIYFALCPFLTIIILLRKDPLDFGLGLGNSRVWLMYVAVSIMISVPFIYLSSRLASIDNYYAMADSDFFKLSLVIAVRLFSWEFLIRGFLLFGLEKTFKESSIIIQMVPFTLLHLGKPFEEVIICIPMGLWLGFVAYRGRSFWPAFIIHLFINLSLRWVVNL
jgi:hypothetical protein